MGVGEKGKRKREEEEEQRGGGGMKRQGGGNEEKRRKGGGDGEEKKRGGVPMRTSTAASTQRFPLRGVLDRDQTSRRNRDGEHRAIFCTQDGTASFDSARFLFHHFEIHVKTAEGREG